MNAVARILALLFAVLLVLALPLCLLAFDTGRVVFNPPLLKRIVTDEVVYSDLIPVALEWFSDRRAQQRVNSGEALTGIDEPDIVLLMSFLDRDDWRQVKQEILTADILASLVSVTVDGVYDWIDSEDRVPHVTFALQPFIDRVNSEHGVNSLLIAYGNPWHEDQFNDYVDALEDVVQSVPAEFALTQELVESYGGAITDRPLVLKDQLRTVRMLMRWAWAVPIVLAILIVLLRVRSLRDLACRLGVPLLLGGLLALLPPLTYRGLITNLLASQVLVFAPELIIQEATRSALRLASEIFRPMLVQAIIIGVLGLLLTIWMAAGSRKDKDESDAE